jgi:hypothetical protein
MRFSSTLREADFYRYLWQYHSQYYIKSSIAKKTMATICTSYLTFKCFHPEMIADQQLECVFRGDFAFQEYAVSNWLHHLKSFLQDRGIDGLSSSSLWREFIVLNEWHKDKPVSLSKSDLPSTLDLFQMVDEFDELYGKIDAFSQMSLIHVRHYSLNYSATNYFQKKERRIYCANSTNKDLRLKTKSSVLPTWSAVKASPDIMVNHHFDVQ